MRNCKVGDLAIVVQDNQKMENLGLIVRVLEPYGNMRWSVFNWKTKKYYKKRVDVLFSWTVEVVSEAAQIIYADDAGNLYGKRVGEIPDIFLRPIRPSSTEQTSENHQEEELEYV